MRQQAAGDEDHLTRTLQVLVAFALLGMFGFYVFRAANRWDGRDCERADGDGVAARRMRSVETRRERRWGLARKINYTGDWLFGLSWSLFTGPDGSSKSLDSCCSAGFGSILTYFYPIYFAALLVHRAWSFFSLQ
eukprot:763139-Hanusia_phi.AAC.4